MIQAMTIGKAALRWFAIWLLVTQLILGMIASYSWGKIALNGYGWSFKIMKED